MSDELFPSGPWTGFYTYRPQDKHRMDLHLTFANGHMSGAGNDDIGSFIIKGRYDASSLECRWIKAYLGAHEVYYEGYREGKGIWGRWEIGQSSKLQVPRSKEGPSSNRGGFHIWPKGLGVSESDSAEEPQPMEAIGVGANAI